MNKLLELTLTVLSSLQFVLEEDNSESQGIILDGLIDELDVVVKEELRALPPIHGELLEAGVENLIACIKDSTNRGILNGVPTAKEIMDSLDACNQSESSLDLSRLNDLFKRGAYLLEPSAFRAVQVKLLENTPIL